MDQLTITHLNSLIRELKSFKGSQSEEENSKVSQIWTVDKRCVKNRLKLIVIYKGVSREEGKLLG